MNVFKWNQHLKVAVLVAMRCVGVQNIPELQMVPENAHAVIGITYTINR